MWNVLGARTLCMSGRQLFGIDNFRGTGKPILAIMADPSSIFMSGLAKFKRRTLYANIINDRSVVNYTASIAKTNPYTDLSKVKVNYLKGYEDVILDPQNPVALAPPKKVEPFVVIMQKWLTRIPFLLALAIFIPIGIIAWFVNSAIQTVRSSRRVKKYEKGLAGVNVEAYRMGIWIDEIREAVEDAYENLNSSQDQEYLGLSDSDCGDDDYSTDDDGSYGDFEKDRDDDEMTITEDMATSQEILALERKQSHPNFPTLALAPYQFSAIQALDRLGWRKYQCYIRNRHSHAAIIIRVDKPAFNEGKVVLRHFVKDEFLA